MTSCLKMCGNCIHYCRDREHSDVTGTLVGVAANCSCGHVMQLFGNFKSYARVKWVDRLSPETPACPLFNAVGSGSGTDLSEVTLTGLKLAEAVRIMAVEAVPFVATEGLFNARDEYTYSPDIDAAKSNIQFAIDNALESILTVVTDSMHGMYAAQQERIEELEKQVRSLTIDRTHVAGVLGISLSTPESCSPEPSLEQTCPDEPE